MRNMVKEAMLVGASLVTWAAEVTGLAGSRIRTHAGMLVDPAHLEPTDIRIADIAHSLSMQCRFTGHTMSHYCPTPEQTVLTADLRWIPSGDLKVGTELLAFDETPWMLGAAGNRRRRFRHAQVLDLREIRLPIIRLEMKDGSTVRASAEHPWLVATKQSRNQKWLSSALIADHVHRGHKRYMHRFVDTWAPGTSFTAGWLSGLYDGEGYISFVGRKGVQLGLAQNPGAVLERAKGALASMGLTYRDSTTGSNNKTISLQTTGGWRQMLMLLGVLRPVRLLGKFLNGLRGGYFDKQMDGIGEPQEIIRTYDEGMGTVIGIETSTHTYLCEGFGAHNSVAQHSILASEIVPRQFALEALLHDASEAYLSDISSPVKYGTLAGIFYMVLERRAEKAIRRRYGLPEKQSPEVTAADHLLLLAEQRDIMGHAEEAGAPALKVVPWDGPLAAKRKFLDRFYELTMKGIAPCLPPEP